MTTVLSDPSRLLRVLVGAAVLLLVVSLASTAVHLETGRAGRVQRVFDLDEERALPTWWAAVQHALLGLVCVDLAVLARGARRRVRAGWWLTGAALLLVSADEVAGVHEEFNGVFTALTGLDDGVFRFGWVFFAVPLVVVFALLVVPLLRSLPRSVRRELVAGGAVFVLGAVGAEVVGSLLRSAGWSWTSWPYVLQHSVEEVLELIGVALALHAAVRHRAALLAARPEASQASGRVVDVRR